MVKLAYTLQNISPQYFEYPPTLHNYYNKHLNINGARGNLRVVVIARLFVCIHLATLKVFMQYQEWATLQRMWRKYKNKQDMKDASEQITKQ